MEGDPNLRSLQSLIRSFILFKNITERNIDIYWVNYTSKFIHYTRLKPNETSKVNTYETHPWVFKDSETGERMHVAHNLVYFPEPWYTRIDHTGRFGRILVEIHFPMRTLKESCLWRVLNSLKNKENFLDLELPKSIIDELRICYNLYLRNNNKTIL
uniref:Putative e3 ubiquitin ligase vhl component von hippel-lindau tumor suppressor in s n=1 Tax=Corethrella appendiculata TaxID=1370023 RepID=U5EUF5_9DIPT